MPISYYVNYGFHTCCAQRGGGGGSGQGGGLMCATHEPQRLQIKRLFVEEIARRDHCWSSLFVHFFLNPGSDSGNNSTHLQDYRDPMSPLSPLTKKSDNLCKSNHLDFS